MQDIILAQLGVLAFPESGHFPVGLAGQNDRKKAIVSSCSFADLNELTTQILHTISIHGINPVEQINKISTPILLFLASRIRSLTTCN